MPFTFLSHQAPVVPLKLVDAGRLDGVALVVGSMAPDLAYVVLGTSLTFDAHTVAAQVWFSVPVAILISSMLRRWVARPLAAHLPAGGPLHLRDYASVADSRHPLAVTALSGLLGGGSHIFLDAFTHDDGYFVRRSHWLRIRIEPFGQRVPVFGILQGSFTVLGAIVTLWSIWMLGRRRALRRLGPGSTGSAGRTQAATASSRLRLWGTVAAGTLAGLAAGWALYPAGEGSAFVIRVAWGAALGLLVGCSWAASHLVPDEGRAGRSLTASGEGGRASR